MEKDGVQGYNADVKMSNISPERSQFVIIEMGKEMEKIKKKWPS